MELLQGSSHRRVGCVMTVSAVGLETDGNTKSVASASARLAVEKTEHPCPEPRPGSSVSLRGLGKGVA